MVDDVIAMSVCPYCEKDVSLSKMIDHMKIEHPKEYKKWSKVLIDPNHRVHICPYCYNSFTSANFQRHIEKKHPEKALPKNRKKQK